MKFTWIQQFVMGAALVLAGEGCSTAPTFKGIPVSETAVLITSVPPLLQDKKVTCGPACVAAVAAYWEVDYMTLYARGAAAEVRRELAAAELGDLAGQLGLQHFILQGNLHELEQNLQKGRPVIAMIPAPDYHEGVDLNINGLSLKGLQESFHPKASHWVIVLGYTADKVIYQDPAEGRLAVSKTKFEGWWKARKSTCLLVLPAQREAAPIQR